MWSQSVFAIVVVAVAVCIAGETPAADIRAKAEVSCQATAKPLQYDCTIKLTDAHTNAPLTGVTLMVGADMPSMPMAHNVRPVRAEPGTEPGTYQAWLELEMTGVWALRLNIDRPLRDRIVKVLRFEDVEVTPVKAASPAHKGHK